MSAGPDPLLSALFVPPCYCLVYRQTLVAITVRDTGPPAPVIACNDPEDCTRARTISNWTVRWENEPAGASYSWSGTEPVLAIDRYGQSASDVFRAGACGRRHGLPLYGDAGGSGIDNVTEDVTVTVLDTTVVAPSLTCNDSEVYEATANFTLNCSVGKRAGGRRVFVGSSRKYFRHE